MFLAIHVPDCSAETHAALLDCASAFSPRVEDTSPNTVVLDIQGLERLFGSYDEIADRLNLHISHHISEAGLGTNIAIASNPDTAAMAARGIDGITIIQAGQESARLKDLGIDLLQLPQLDEETHRTLALWGIHTLGALAKLPVKAISERLGQAGVGLHKLARGGASRPLVPQSPALSFEEGMELDDSIDVLEPLTFILSRLLDQLFARLRRRGLAASELRLHLERERPHQPYTRVLSLPFPVEKARFVTRLLMLDLETRPPGAPVIGVKVRAIPARPRVIQNGLFTPLSPEPEKLELTLSRITAVVGEGNVGKAVLEDSHARDRFRIRRFGEFGIRIPDSRFRKTMALRLWRPALEATVQMKDGAPVWIAFAGFHGPIGIASGPWNSSGDWWNSKRWHREEWDIAAMDGTLLRIFEDCTNDCVGGRWYAEGIYD